MEEDGAGNFSLISEPKTECNLFLKQKDNCQHGNIPSNLLETESYSSERMQSKFELMAPGLFAVGSSPSKKITEPNLANLT